MASIFRLLSLSGLLWCVSGTWKGEGQPLEYFIVEELDGGTLLGNVAVDYKLTEKFNSTVIQSLSFHIDPLQSTKQHLFAIGSKTGILSTTDKIDRDAVCPGENVCLAWLHIKVLPEGITKDIRIMLEIVDVNDHAPRFESKILPVKFRESARIGTSVELPTATDEDSGSNGIQEYELVSPSDLFELEVIKEENTDQDVPATKLKLKLAGSLNRDVSSQYLLRLVAHDDGKPSKSGTLRINVTIEDVNNHDPRFDNATYIASVRENTPPGTLVTTVKARDFDLGENAAISYRLSIETDEKYGELFGIDTNTGTISLKKELDFEKRSMYFLVITATDNGQVSKSAEASVIVRVLDENDNSPVITVNGDLTNTGAIEAPENLTSGSFVAHLTVSDHDGGDNGQVECSMNSNTFFIEKVFQAQFRILSKTDLDREALDSYTITVVCHDLGDEPKMATQTVKIIVTDINDNAPAFTQEIYHTHISKDKALSEVLLQVKAADPDLGLNGQVNYKVHPNAADIFSIDQASGDITMKTRLKLDGASRMQFRVIAYDLGSPSLSSTATVVVNNAPTQPLVTPEFALPNYEFGVFENSPPETDVGSVSLKTPHSGGESAVNDYEFSFDDTSSDVHSFFTIDPASGQMKTKTTFDREEQSVYYMAVKAVSKSHPYISGTVSVTVYIADKNDNAPVVTYPTERNHTVRVPSSAPLDHPVAKVKALDPDLGGNSKITFAITTGNPGGVFKISTTTGQISLGADLRRNKNSKFTLQILVSDTGYPRFSTSTTLVVLVDRTLVSDGSPAPGSTSSQDMVDSSHATIVVAVTAASLITVFLVLFGVMVFLIWRRMQPVGDKQHQSDKYCYSNMEADPSGSMSGAARSLSHRHSSRPGLYQQSDLAEAGQLQGAAGGGLSPGDGMDECRQIHQQQPGTSQLPRPKSNIIDGSDFCLNTDLEKQRLSNIEKNMLLQVSLFIHYIRTVMVVLCIGGTMGPANV